MHDFVLLCLYYIYFNILNYDVTVSHKKHMNISIINFGCIHFEIILKISSTCC